MFFPKLSPGQMVGQSLDIAATFLGVSMVQIGDAVFAGPLFRDGQNVFLLHSDQQGDGKTVCLRFIDIGDREGTRVLDHTAHIAALTERVIADKQLIAELRKNCETLLEQHQIECNTGAAHAARADRLDRALTELNAERVEIVNRLAIAEAQVQRYADLVGPLDNAFPTINDEIAEQLTLMEAENEPVAPVPPPVVEPGPAAYDAPGLAGETIAREGSVTDHAFRRLMFLTRGDDLL